MNVSPHLTTVDLMIILKVKCLRVSVIYAYLQSTIFNLLDCVNLLRHLQLTLS